MFNIEPARWQCCYQASNRENVEQYKCELLSDVLLEHDDVESAKPYREQRNDGVQSLAHS